MKAKMTSFSLLNLAELESHNTVENTRHVRSNSKCRIEDFDGVTVFDDCHQAKNYVPIGFTEPIKTGLAVLELQNKLPKARILYVSATGASESSMWASFLKIPNNIVNSALQQNKIRKINRFSVLR